MPRTTDPALEQPLAWTFLAAAPLLATAPTLAGSIALAVAIPAAILATVLAVHALPAASGRAARAGVTIVLSVAIAMAAIDAVAALWPSVGDGPARWLPLAVPLAAYAVAGPDVEAGARRALVTALLAIGISTLVLAFGRDWAGRVSHVALSPAGAFVAIGLALAFARYLAAARNGRAAERTT